MKFRFFSVVILVLFVYACKPVYIQQGMKQIDSLNLMLNDVDKKLAELDTASIRLKYDQYQQSLRQIQQFTDYNYTQEEWAAMTQWGHIRKPIRNFLQQLPGFYEEVTYSKSQLENLKHDMSKKLIERNLVEEYLAKEKEAVEVFVQRFDLYYSNAITHVNKFDSLYPVIRTVIDHHDNNEE